MPRSLTTPALLAALVMIGCGENPAENVPKATVADAKPAPATSPKPGEIGGMSATQTAPTADAAKAAPAPAATASAPAPAPASLAITPASSKIEFIGSKTVGGSHNGGFKTFNGAIELSPDAAGIKQISVDIDTNSITSDDPKLTTHLKAADFFEVEKYPTAKFVTTEIKPTTAKGATHSLVGNLTLHGVTKSITIPAEVKVEGSNVTIKSEFSLDKNDFGMTFAGPGNVIRKDVVIKLDVKGDRKS